jgi:hypothetical protein
MCVVINFNDAKERLSDKRLTDRFLRLLSEVENPLNAVALLAQEEVFNENRSNQST